MFSFPHTVTKKSLISNNGYDDTYGTGSSLSCNYEKIEKLIEGQGNRKFLTCAWVQFPKGTSVTDTDQITLPDGTTSPIVSSTRPKLPSGIETCVEVWLGKELYGGL